MWILYFQKFILDFRREMQQQLCYKFLQLFSHESPKNLSRDSSSNSTIKNFTESPKVISLRII